jgi:PAS domain S-box-containing protein
MKAKMEQFPVINPNPVLSAEKDGTVLYSNEAGEPLLHEWGLIVGEKLPSCIMNVVQRVISLNSPEKIEVKSGNRTYSVSFYPSPEEECVNIYGFDISDQNDLEKKLRESEENLAEVQKMAHIGNWKWNIATNELRWSDEVYRIFGLIPQEFEVTFDAYFDYVHPDDRDYLKNAIIKALKGEPYSIDNRIITANGEERIVHTDAEIVFNEDNIPVCARGIVQDITEHKRTVEALRESEERYKTFFNTSAVGTVEIDVTGRLIKVNDRYCQITGYSCEELLRMNIVELSHPDDRDHDRKLLADYFNGGAPTFDIEKRYVLKNGRVIWVEVTAAIVRDSKSRPLRSTGVVQDITERKKTEEALKKAHEILEEKVKERTAELEKAYNLLKESEEGLAEAQRLAHLGNWD